MWILVRPERVNSLGRIVLDEPETWISVRNRKIFNFIYFGEMFLMFHLFFLVGSGNVKTYTADDMKILAQ